MKVLAIIPARAGSTRIKNKSIVPFAGRPLIWWTIKTALAVKTIDRVVVTTDSPEIAAIAKKAGAEVPFLRPLELATETSAIEPVLKHTLEELEKQEGYKPDAVALIFATNPLKLPKHLTDMIDILKKKKADSVVSVSRALGNRNPAWLLTKNKKGEIRLASGKPLKKIPVRSQDLPVYYSRNDIAYILKPKNLYEKIPNLYGNKVELYEMDEFFDGDINTPEDLELTLNKFKRSRKN